MYFKSHLTRCCSFKIQSSLKYKPQNVVITGSTKGIGKSIAKKMFLEGHNVVISSSNKTNVSDTYKEFVTIKDKQYKNNCFPIVADVSNDKDCLYLLQQSIIRMGSVDIWINNAGVNTKNLLGDLTSYNIQQIIDVNLVGTIFCCKYVIPYMVQQKKGILINFEGAGSNGFSTPNYSVYGASKCAITQFTKSITKEYKDTNVKFCTISPGMVLTELIMSNMDNQMKTVFNIFCENSDVIAKYLVSEIYKINANTHIKYLTLNRVLILFLLSFFRKYRFFDKKGNLTKKDI